ncbi:type IV toxin-antitoxin system AbiEi family antitoxin domain-containing protein [Streptomonospora sp. PA3]|uniref:type IV toxin-antitoxin system AbiEi family antitoxin domain-containing protein n=1 Tax=Streptomonospora sp. PA3 TaxID=2607326 RepID=UPI0012DE396D|nr:type IV toxin-antitoxin system AbiEi family antitoxin domain-containing protein [Streptomonospora sp. PA3]MUL42912.1 type IV toxin-antitoxin system AbiEi family antitoxin domain-containing protein [Streptomonospora sp. PA3]
MNWETSYYELTAVAARQLGFVTAAQAARVGVPAAALDRFGESGLVLEIDTAVFQLSAGQPDPIAAHPYAAWLALSPDRFAWERPAAPHEDAVLSHHSAARLLRLGAPSQAGLVFTAPEERAAPAGTTVRAAPLAPDEVTRESGVPVTTAHRTVLDLIRGGTAHDEVGGVLLAALRGDLVDIGALHTDLAPLAERFGFAADGAAFVDHFLGEAADSVPLSSLSQRNARGLARLRFPSRVAEVEDLLRAAAAERAADSDAAVLARDPDLVRGIAAEITARSDRR